MHARGTMLARHATH